MLLLCLLCAGAAYSQTTPPPNKTALSGWTPIAQQPGAPAGSYALSGFDNINLFNGHLNFRLPLMKVGGRGKAGYEMMLPIEQNWRVETVAVPHCDQSGCGYYESDYRYIANPIWWTGIRPGFGPGVLQGRQSGDGGSVTSCGFTYYETLTRLTFTASDGTEFELRDWKTGGEPKQGGPGPNCWDGYNRGKLFVTTDGSSATFISTADISDFPQPQGNNNVIYPSGELFLRDGTRYHIVSGVTQYIVDTNGNKISFNASGTTYTIDDSLNRRITVDSSTNPTVISFKGASGNARTIKVYSGMLHDALRKHPDGSTEYTIKTFAQLFSLQNVQNGNMDISVITAVELPDQRQYQFRYDSYANLAQVILPTGGRMEYDWSTSTYQFGDHVKGIYSRVLERRTAVNTTTTTYETRTTYSISDPLLQSTISIRRLVL
jgi:YD repeat-containing protein